MGYVRTGRENSLVAYRGGVNVAERDVRGYPTLPGLYSDPQIAAWNRVTAAVHRAGGRIVAQLWHVGRPRFAEASRPQSPGWALATPLRPHDLSATDLTAMHAGFAQGARAAHAAGFDGVEIHNGNGYLLDQFLRAAADRDRLKEYRAESDAMAIQILAARRQR